jgi:MATE family multidrug resistance protein
VPITLTSCLSIITAPDWPRVIFLHLFLQAALGINTSLFSLSFILFNFLATATTPAVATAVSSSNNRAAGETIWQATSLAVLLGLFVAAGMLGNGRWMLEMMGADQSQQHMQDLALQYLYFR